MATDVNLEVAANKTRKPADGVAKRPHPPQPERWDELVVPVLPDAPVCDPLDEPAQPPVGAAL
jgi:hypothetical protein